MAKQSGFTLVEVLITIGLLGVIAALLVPKLLLQNENTETKALVRENFHTLGEMTLSCGKDEDYSSAGPCSPGNLALYLYDHLNYHRTGIPARASISATDFAVESDYFTLVTGSKIRSISAVSSPVAGTRIKVQIPRGHDGNTIDLILIVPNDEDRFSTLRGFDDTQPCTEADAALNICTR